MSFGEPRNGFSMSVHENISDYKKNNLHIDFHELTLSQNDCLENPIIYHGGGYIEQASDGKILFRLYATVAENTDFLNDTFFKNNTPVGKLYPKSSYYSLRGVDTKGVVWESDRVLPGSSWSDSYDAPVMHGHLDEITRSTSGLKKHIVKLVFSDIPKSRIDHRDAEFDFLGCSFRAVFEDRDLFISINIGDNNIKSIEIRVEEALCFLFGRRINAQIIFHDGKITFLSREKKSISLRIHPPIALHSGFNSEIYWDLFRSYLAHVVKYSNPSLWAPVSAYLRMAQEASANSAQAWAIGLGVAIEGLVGLVEIEEDPENKKQMGNLKDFIVDCVSRHEQFRSMSDRVGGILSGLGRIRPIDRLNWLASSGKVSSSSVRTWRDMRNRSVHPVINSNHNSLGRDFQKLLDEINCATVLMYQIVFYIIDYKGGYTDYSKDGFPSAEFA